jgi:hypothetical protein
VDAEREPGFVEIAVRRDLAAMPGLAESGLAATALDLARRLDAADVRPAAASMLAAQLRATLLDLRKLAPPVAEEDGVDELRARRAERLA